MEQPKRIRIPYKVISDMIRDKQKEEAAKQGGFVTQDVIEPALEIELQLVEKDLWFLATLIVFMNIEDKPGEHIVTLSISSKENPQLFERLAHYTELNAPFLNLVEKSIEKNVPLYYLIYLTPNIRGLEKVKDATWAVLGHHDEYCVSYKKLKKEVEYDK